MQCNFSCFGSLGVAETPSWTFWSWIVQKTKKAPRLLNVILARQEASRPPSMKVNFSDGNS